MIVAVAGNPVNTVAQLLGKVASLPPGTAAKFEVQRLESKLSLDVTPGVRPKPRVTPAR